MSENDFPYEINATPEWMEWWYAMPNWQHGRMAGLSKEEFVEGMKNWVRSEPGAENGNAEHRYLKALSSPKPQETP